MTRYNYGGVECENCQGYNKESLGKLTFYCTIKETREVANFTTASDCLRKGLYKGKGKINCE